jgi:molybdopterin adenylyltransferase
MDFQMGPKAHKKHAPTNVRVGVLTVSTTRTIEDDPSGDWIGKQVLREGHQLCERRMVTDERFEIDTAVREMIRENGCQVLIVSGGTGIAPRDVTIEAVRPLFSKELTAFSVLFAQLSFEEIDSAAILSRSTAGIFQGAVIFCIPGSLKACKLACSMLIFPELGHLVSHLQER